MSILLRIYRVLLQVFCIPVLLSGFLDKRTGSAYGVRLWTKWRLVFKMAYNNTQIVSGSSFLEHLFMATSLLRIDPAQEGVVVECGTYKGVSAANLSLVCALVNRPLEIFDSFEGLPEPGKADESHAILASAERHTYDKGSWCGQLEEVRENIRRYGNVEVCRFHKGFFDKTLPHFKTRCVQVFVDVDYRQSLETCVTALWPLLQDNGTFYTHEAMHMEIAGLFYSDGWWQEHFQCDPPGLVGAGSGIGIKILTGSFFNSSLGYTIKNPSKSRYRNVSQPGGMKLGLGASIKLTAEGKKAPHEPTGCRSISVDSPPPKSF